MGGVLQKGDSLKACLPETKLEAKIIEAMRRREREGSSMKSFNSIILKFPKIDENLRKCKAIFQEFNMDGNSAIDPQELKHCFRKLDISFSDEEINDLFEEYDINDDMGMKFNEFIFLLCLVYLLKDDPAVQHARWECQILRLHLRCLVDAFVFLDKNKDGHVNKNEMVEAVNETSTGERSSGRIAMKRFEEMDWDKNGMVNFKEFLFAITQWVGIEDDASDGDDDDDDDEGGEEEE